MLRLPFIRKRTYADTNELNIHINNLNGVFQIVAANLVLPFATMFAKRLDASDLEVAFLSSLPAIVSVGVIIPGAIFVQRCKDKKNVTARFFITSRVFYLLFALVPFAAQQYRASLFVLLYGFMNLPGSIALVSWQSFIAGLFRPSLRGQALALRNRLSTLVGIVTTLATGWLLYNIPKTDNQRLVMYQCFFAAAFIFALLEIYLFYKHKEPDREECAAVENTIKLKPSLKLKRTLEDIKANKRFISFCTGAFIFHLSWYMAWPLFPIYEIDYLGSNEAWTSILVSLSGFSSALSYPYWERFSRKKGNSLALSIAIIGLALSPLSYALIRTIYLVIPVSIVSGVAMAGITLVLLNALFEVSPDGSRPMYIAYYNTMINSILAFAPFIGIVLKNSFDIYTAFIIAGIARLFAGIIFYVRYRKEERIRT